MDKGNLLEILRFPYQKQKLPRFAVVAKIPLSATTFINSCTTKRPTG